jgi:hypothetical protein
MQALLTRWECSLTHSASFSSAQAAVHAGPPLLVWTPLPKLAIAWGPKRRSNVKTYILNLTLMGPISRSQAPPS